MLFVVVVVAILLIESSHRLFFFIFNSIPPTLYTANCRNSNTSCPMIKFADDSEITGQIKNDDDSMYMEEINNFVKWRNED